MTPEPLILTIRMDGESFAVLDCLRRQHFPPARNVVPAHITLFHQLPGRELRAIARYLDEVCRPQSPFVIATTGVRFLGRGVAIELSSNALDDLRAELAGAWSTWLSPQDRQRFHPHVTIQNKVDPHEAKALYAHLQNAFAPMRIEGSGLCLWRYKGGPWDKVDEFTFRSRAS